MNDELRWRGKLIRDLTREELEAAFVMIAKRNMQLTSSVASEERALGRIQMLKRGAA